MSQNKSIANGFLQAYSSYLPFLQFSLEDNAPVPSNLSHLDWRALYAFARKHCIEGVLFRGISRLEASLPHPDKSLLLRWISTSEQIRRTNHMVNETAVHVYNKFAADGFRGCILKGQGNTTMYPDPYARTPGDIDIWLEGYEGDILRYARSYDAKAIVNYHHVQLHIPDIKVPIEIHFTPSFCGNLFYNARMRKFFKAHAEEQFANLVPLPGHVGSVAIPCDGFNRIFQLSHTMHHFFFEGIGLRQIIDYYYLLKRGFTEEERLEDIRVLKELGMYKFAKAMMYVQKTVLALDEKFLLVEPDERLGNLLLTEVLAAGNFGFYDTRYKFAGRSRLGQYLLELYRNFHFALDFPAEALWGRPIFRIWHQFEKRRIEKSAQKSNKH